MPLNARQRYFLASWRDRVKSHPVFNAEDACAIELENDAAMLWLDIVDTLTADLKAERGNTIEWQVVAAAHEKTTLELFDIMETSWPEFRDEVRNVQNLLRDTVAKKIAEGRALLASDKGDAHDNG